uniref:Uncharacterized protein n=1 Tax=Arundo donax TaxID=35708 RepID=A0A0A9HEF5_ARUDO
MKVPFHQSTSTVIFDVISLTTQRVSYGGRATQSDLAECALMKVSNRKNRSTLRAILLCKIKHSLYKEDQNIVSGRKTEVPL